MAGSALIIDYVGDRVVNTLASTITRPVSLPAGASKVRVAIRAMGSTYLAGGVLGLGLCKGTTNVLGDATTDHFIGAYIPGFSNNGSYQYSVCTAYAYNREGTTNTTGGALANNFQWKAGAYFSHFFVDIYVKSPGVFGITLPLYSNNAQSLGAPSASEAVFSSQLGVVSPSASYHTSAAEQTVAGTTSDFPSNLNTLCLYWSSAGIGFYVSDFGVAVTA